MKRIVAISVKEDEQIIKFKSLKSASIYFDVTYRTAVCRLENGNEIADGYVLDLPFDDDE